MNTPSFHANTHPVNLLSTYLALQLLRSTYQLKRYLGMKISHKVQITCNCLLFCIVVFYLIFITYAREV